MSLSEDNKVPSARELVLPVLRRWVDLPEREWAYLEPRLRPCTLSRRQALTEAGRVADRFGFVARGLVRKLHVTERGKNVVRGFGRPGDLVGAYASLISGEPSTLRVEALVPTELYVVEAALLPLLYARHGCWQELGRRIAEQLLLEREARAHELLTLSASERYARFCATHGELANQLHSYDIASYLGITPVSLSRLRARRARGPAQSPTRAHAAARRRT